MRALPIVLATLFSTTATATPPDPSAVARGRVIFRSACAACHGARGDGKSEAAAALSPGPADLTRGVFRYRGTPTGSLPTDEDLARTIRLGAPSTSMPAWGGHLADDEIADVVAFVKSLSPRFSVEDPEAKVTIPEPPPRGGEAVARGKEVYKRLQCGKCHGERGRGDGWAKADEMKDDLGRVVHARDFTSGRYRGGAAPADLYRTLVTGLDGTPMPAYEGEKPDDLWDLVDYTLSLSRKKGLWFWLSEPPAWDEPLSHR